MEKAIQNGTDGDWQQEASYNEEVKLVWHHSDLRFEGILMRRADDAEKSGDWEHCLEVFLGNGRLIEWTSAKVRECYNEVEQKDEDPTEHSRGYSAETDFLRRIIVPVEGQGGVTLSYVCP